MKKSSENTRKRRVEKFFREEKEKIRGLSFAEKAEYVAEYYWIWILGAAAVLFLLIYIPYRMFFAKTDYWFYAIFANTAADAGNQSPLWYDFAVYAGFDMKEKGMEMNAASYFDPTVRGGTVNSYFQAFVAVAEGGDLDVLTMGTEEGIAAVGASGRLADLGTADYASIREKYGDRFVYCTPYDEEYSTEPVPVAIDVSDSLLMTKYGFYEDHCYLAVGANTKRPESAELFLDFLYSEETYA